MLINNIDIKNYNAKLLTKKIGNAEIINYQEWLRNAYKPIQEGQEQHYTPIELGFCVKGTNLQNTLENISNLTAQLRKSTIKFNDVDFFFNCILDSVDTQRYTDTMFTLNVNLKSEYKYKQQIAVIANKTSTVVIDNPGNLISPAVVEITPTVNISNITIGTFTLANLTTNKQVIVSTEDYTVLEAGVNKFADFTGDFPVLSSGVNTILISNTNCNINIKYKQKFI